MLALFLRVQALQVPELRRAVQAQDWPAGGQALGKIRHRRLQPAPRPVADSPGSGTPEPLNRRCAGSPSAGLSSEAHDVQAAVAAVGAVRAVLSRCARTTGIHRGRSSNRWRYPPHPVCRPLPPAPPTPPCRRVCKRSRGKSPGTSRRIRPPAPPGPPSLPDWPSPPFSALPQRQPEACRKPRPGHRSLERRRHRGRPAAGFPPPPPAGARSRSRPLPALCRRCRSRRARK